MFSDPASFAQAFLVLQDRISHCPHGTISGKARRRKNGTVRLDYYYQYYVDGVRHEKYIRRADIEAVLEQFEQKKQWKLQFREMKAQLQTFSHEDRKRVRAAIALGEEWNIIHADEEALQTEKAEDELRLAASPGTNIILPPAEISSSGLRVRSRAEEICLSIALEYGLNVRYEVAIETEEQILRHLPPYSADFEITKPSGGRRWFWEHLGRVDDPVYMEHQQRKLRDYRWAGLIMGENLIVTTSRRHVNKQTILWELIRAGAIDPCEARRHYRRERRLLKNSIPTK